MILKTPNKRKIINDPIYGFINIPYNTIFDLIEHPYFQRLRRIKQLGLTSLVYPGANHTRFHHALGAMHLMTQAIEVLKSKGITITDEESEGATIAILLHDMGHGPFSHSLENNIINGIEHEEISLRFMNELNNQFKGKLDLAIKIFKNEYHKKFLHQLVSSQLDVDRLDYLCRDSFYTGVSEGVIGHDRILKMLYVIDDNLVIEHKGIYSIENFLNARRLMYWQVYHHKTVLSAEILINNILKRAKELASQSYNLFCTPSFSYFLYNKIEKKQFYEDKNILENFAYLDDNDIIACIKVWMKSEDFILSHLCSNLINRNLYKIEFSNTKFESKDIEGCKKKTFSLYNLEKEEDINYFIKTDKIVNNAYCTKEGEIKILFKDKLVDFADFSEDISINILSKNVEKYYFSYPKNCKSV